MTKHHTVSSYEHELQNLLGRILHMFDDVNNFLRLIAEIFSNQQQLKHGDYSFQNAIEIDNLINAQEVEIENLATAMVALRQPFGGDLRLVISCFKIVSTLESIGDLAKNVIKRLERFNREIEDDLLPPLHQMATQDVEMLKSVRDIFSAKDDSSFSRLNDIIEEDDIVDNLYRSFFISIQNSTSQDNILNLTEVIFVAKNLERIGDYIGKLATTIKYIKTGLREEEKN